MLRFRSLSHYYFEHYNHCLHHINIKVSKFFEATNPLSVNEVELFVAESAEEVRILRNPVDQ